jgi:toxin HigB-1
MIRSFRSKAIMRFWIDDNPCGLRADQTRRIYQVLELLDDAMGPEDMNLPGLRFHRLRGKPVRYSVTVTANWRLTFAWDDGDAIDVDYEDYH